jgi:hypothetical protein
VDVAQKVKRRFYLPLKAKGKRAGFIAMQAVNSVCHDNVEKFVAEHLDTSHALLTQTTGQFSTFFCCWNRSTF